MVCLPQLNLHRAPLRLRFLIPPIFLPITLPKPSSNLNFPAQSRRTFEIKKLTTIQNSRPQEHPPPSTRPQAAPHPAVPRLLHHPADPRQRLDDVRRRNRKIRLRMRGLQVRGLRVRGGARVRCYVSLPTQLILYSWEGKGRDCEKQVGRGRVRIGVEIGDEKQVARL